MTAVDFRRTEGRSLVPEWQLAIPEREGQEELSESREQPTLFPFSRAEATRTQTRELQTGTYSSSGWGCCSSYCQTGETRPQSGEARIDVSSEVIQSYQSALDTTKTVTWHKCAVTLICAAGTNHAEIVIESIQNGKKLVRIAHLMGIDRTGRHQILATVRLDNQTEGRIRYDGKTSTSEVAMEKVAAMIETINKEIHDPANHPRPFNYFGRDSAFSRSVIYIKGRGVMDLLPLVERIRKPVVQFETWITGGTPLTELPEREHSVDYVNRLRRRYGEENVKVLPADNCLTWAREKLSMLDIPLSESCISWIANITRLYTNPGQLPVKIKGCDSSS